jgi:hypothetical protein
VCVWEHENARSLNALDIHRPALRFEIHASAVQGDRSAEQQVATRRLFRLLARIIHECRRKAVETEARRGFSHVRPTETYVNNPG